MKESIKNDAYKMVCRNGTEESMNRCKIMNNNGSKAVLKLMRREAEEGLNELRNYQYGMFSLVRATICQSVAANILGSIICCFCAIV